MLFTRIFAGAKMVCHAFIADGTNKRCGSVRPQGERGSPLQHPVMLRAQ
jgi:hypothetical protein